MKKPLLALLSLFYLPLLVPYALTSARQVIHADMRRWMQIERFPATDSVWGVLQLLSRSESFRSVFYFRILKGNLLGRPFVYVLRPIYHGMPVLYLRKAAEIGEGLYVQHGFSTVVNARIGRNFWVNQQVTIGFKDDAGVPTIGDNVHVAAGAKVLGNIRIGDNVIVGANAVVTKDVPSNCVVAGVPARVIQHLDANGRPIRDPARSPGA